MPSALEASRPNVGRGAPELALDQPGGRPNPAADPTLHPCARHQCRSRHESALLTTRLLVSAGEFDRWCRFDCDAPDQYRLGAKSERWHVGFRALIGSAVLKRVHAMAQRTRVFSRVGFSLFGWFSERVALSDRWRNRVYLARGTSSRRRCDSLRRCLCPFIESLIQMSLGLPPVAGLLRILGERLIPIVALLENVISVLCGSFAGVKREWSSIERTLRDSELFVRPSISVEF